MESGNTAGIQKRSFLRECVSLAPSPLPEGLEGGGVVALEPAGSGLLSGGEGRKGGSRALSLYRAAPAMTLSASDFIVFFQGRFCGRPS